MSGCLRGRFLWAVAFVCLFAIAAAAPGVAFSAEEDGGAQGEALARLPLPDEAALSSSLAAELQAHRQQVQQRADELAGPEAAAEREHSREAYAGLGRTEAEDLLRSVFGGVLDGLDQDPARFLSDAQVEQVDGTEAATVTSEGETQLFEANVPVQTEAEDGSLGKVDVTL